MNFTLEKPIPFEYNGIHEGIGLMRLSEINDKFTDSTFIIFGNTIYKGQTCLSLIPMVTKEIPLFL